MSTGPSISLVVPATNDPETLPTCLAAIERSLDRPDEVIVVRQPAQLSASEARNSGVEAARGDVVLFVDADVEIHPDAVGRVREAFAAAPELTALHGSYDDAPAGRSLVSAFRNLLHHHVHHANAGEVDTFWTGLGAVRRSAFVEVGGFDARRYPHPSVEDIDLGGRLRARGGELRLDPAIQGKHLKVWTLPSMLWTDFARRAVPWLALQFRSRRLEKGLNCGWVHRLSAVASVVVMVALLTASWLALGVALVVLIALNRSFYGLLARQTGTVRAVVSVPLHVLHHLVAVAAVPVAVVAAMRGTRSVSSARHDAAYESVAS